MSRQREDRERERERERAVIVIVTTSPSSSVPSKMARMRRLLKEVEAKRKIISKGRNFCPVKDLRSTLHIADVSLMYYVTFLGSSIFIRERDPGHFPAERGG